MYVMIVFSDLSEGCFLNVLSYVMTVDIHVVEVAELNGRGAEAMGQ